MNMQLMIQILLVAVTSAVALPTFNSYSDMKGAGYYFFPGIDCQVRASHTEAIFSATKDDDHWAVFSFKRVPQHIATSGYQIRQLISEQVGGETIKCHGSLMGDENAGNDLIEIHRIYGGDPDSPDYVTFILGRNAHGDFTLKSCGWGYAPGEPYSKDGHLFVKYFLKDGRSEVKPATGSDVCFVAD